MNRNSAHRPQRTFVALGFLLVISALLSGCGLSAAPGGQAAAPTTAAPQATDAAPTDEPPTPAPDAAPTTAPTSAPPALAPTTAVAIPTDQPPTPAPSAAPTTAPTTLAQTAPATPDCADLTLTPAQTEGPYYTPNTPERASLLEAGMTGTRLIVTGYVVNQDCQPIAGAKLDFWQADAEGVYDNQGYRLRGHQFTDAEGRYRLETVVPGEYPGRTPHIHVKVQAPNQPELITQLYLPDAPGNQRDGIFSPALVMDMQETADGLVGTFHFVLNTP